MPNAAALTRLHDEIDARVASIRENRPEWLCGKGCDHCCRRLAENPQLTAAEWALLEEGLAGLAPDHLREIGRKMAALAGQSARPVVCPLLDETSGACPVYAQRDLGLYCHDIESRVAAGALADVVWGNHDAIDRQLAGLGVSRPLTAWFADRENRPD